MALCLLLNQRMRWSILAAAMLPAIAGAQQMTITLNGTSNNKVVSNNCDEAFTVNWAATFTGIPCQAPTLWITSSASCADTPTGSDVPLTPAPASSDRSGALTTKKIRELLANNADGGVTCPATVKVDFLVCGTFKYNSFSCGSGDILVKASPPTIEYKGTPPAIPTLSEPVAQDGALTVSVSFDSDTIFVHFYVRQVGTSDFTERAKISSNVTSARIEGLENGTTYEIVARAEDQAGNFSDYSQPVQGTPVRTNGFFRAYRADGGADTGGCGPGAPGAIFFPLLVSVLILLKRKRG
jgi:hypothetical protein